MYITIWKYIWIEYKDYQEEELCTVKQTDRLVFNILLRKREWGKCE